MSCRKSYLALSGSLFYLLASTYVYACSIMLQMIVMLETLAARTFSLSCKLE